MTAYHIEVRDTKGAIQAKIAMSCANDAEAINKTRDLEHHGDVALLYQGLRPVTAFKRKAADQPKLESQAWRG